MSADPKEASLQFKREAGINFPLLSDEDELVIKQYGLLHKGGNGSSDIARPADLLLDREGVIRWAMFTDNIRVRAHPDALLKAAKELR